ncbi:MAG: hypothetical protein CMJ18_02565 [Phycisphaeraceae bacterium]|nr:hypothetical protein [Phycisphaeraceae bacterium]
MNDQAATYPDLPERQKGSWLRLLAFFGPGAIIASVTVGSGETVFASRGGAVFGYTLMWCFVASALFKGIQVYSGSRFMVLTGRHPLESWRELPGPDGWFVWLLAVLTIFWMPFWLGPGLPVMLGDFTNWIVGFRLDDVRLGEMTEAQIESHYATLKTWARLWATLFIVVGVALTWFQTYGFLEKVQTVLVSLLLVCMLVAAISTHPDLVALITGIFVPTPPAFEEWLIQKHGTAFSERSPWVEMGLYMGVIGGGTQDYFGYLGLLREKAWGLLGRNVHDGPPAEISDAEDNLSRGRAWLKAPMIDTGVSFACVLVFTVCFLILGAAILHPNHEVPTGMNLLVVQADYLTHADQSPALQMILAFIYKTGIFFAFFGTIYGAYELYTWTTRECLIAAMPRLRTVPLRRFRFWTLLWCAVPGIALLWGLKGSPAKIVTPAALVGSGLTCGIWCFAILWSDRRHLPSALRMSTILKVLVVLAGLFLCIYSGFGLYNYVLNLLK